MSGQRIAIKLIVRGKKSLLSEAAAKEIYNVEGQRKCITKLIQTFQGR